MLIALPNWSPSPAPWAAPGPLSEPVSPALPRPGAVVRTIECADDEDDGEEDLGDEEDLSVAQPLADEESSFDDFDDEFDDDFEEEEDDPDWDHPDDAEEEPPPAKGPGKKK